MQKNALIPQLCPPRIARNTFFFSGALVVQKLFAVVYFALLARFFGPEDIGKYAFAISFTTIFTIFIDFGLTPFLTRSLAKDDSDGKLLFSNIITLKIFFAAIMYAVVILLILLLDYNTLILKMVALSGIAMVLDSFTLSFWGVFRGRHIMTFESIANIGVQIILVGLGTLFLVTSGNLVLQVFALTVSSVAHFLYAFLLLKRKLSWHFTLRIQKNIVYHTLHEAFPFALGAIFNRVYSFVDIIILSKIAGERALGLYSTSYRLMYALQFIPLAFSASLYPAMSASWGKDPLRLTKLFEESTFFLALIVFPIAFGTSTLAHVLIFTVYGDKFLEATTVLQILMFALIFVFLNFPVGSLLNAVHKQNINTRNQGIAMVLSIILNLLLIPRLGFLGAGITFFSSSLILYILGFAHALKIISLRKNYLILKTCKICISAIGMSIIAFFLKDILHIVFVILFSAIFYSIFLFLFRAISISEVRLLLYSFKKNPREEEAIL